MAKDLPKGYYRVGDGDSYASIAGKLTGDQRNFLRIMQANGGMLRPGDIIKIPGSVKDGNAFISNDTAKSFGMATTDQIRGAYKDNGTGGVGSPRLAMGSFNPTWNPNANNAAPGTNPIVTPGSSFSGPGGERGPTPAAPGAITGQQAAMQWQAANPSLPPAYNVPTTGQSAAMAWRQAAQAQPQPAVNKSGFVPTTLGATATGNNTAVPPISSTPTRATALASNRSGMDVLNETLGFKTTLGPGEKMHDPNMYSPTAQNGQVAASPTGQATSGPPPQYTSSQIATAQQKIDTGMGTMADYNALASSYIAQGWSAEDVQKGFQAKYPELAARIFTQPATDPNALNARPTDSATNGWNWNEPTASGYVSPSGYFVPYAQKKDDGSGLYDFETGRRVGSGKRGGPPAGRRPVPGVRASNLRYGLITWRY